MSAGLDYYLRLMINGDKELKVQAVQITDTPTTVTTALTSGQTRRRLLVVNNSHSQSGEAYFGHDSNLNSQNGFPIEKGEPIEIKVHPDIDVYFAMPSGEIGDLRVAEIA